MLNRKGMLIIALVCVLALTVGNLVQAGDPTPAPRARGRDASESGEPLNTSGFPISLVSNASGHNHETHPSVAYNSGFMKTYLVVWEQPDAFGNQLIYRQFVDRDGTLNGVPSSIAGGRGGLPILTWLTTHTSTSTWWCLRDRIPATHASMV